ncbi:hypothetical protein BC829DRAFT_382523 [Chytridium lagenaria]|nr:hypothetical protein BC829DRAFT_382523 [Chytridium lagenaria]
MQMDMSLDDIIRRNETTGPTRGRRNNPRRADMEVDRLVKPGGREGKKDEEDLNRAVYNYKKPNAIVVNNLHYNVSEPELLEMVTQFGEINDLRIKYDNAGRSEGIAFISFTSPESAVIAKEHLDQAVVQGHPMTVEMIVQNSLPPRPRSPPRSNQVVTFDPSKGDVRSRLGPSTGSKRGADIRGRLGPSSGDVLSRLGPSSVPVFERLGGKRETGRSERSEAPNRRVSATRLEGELEAYMRGEVVVETTLGARGDWDAPPNEVFLRSDGGVAAAGGRAVLNYDDDVPTGGDVGAVEMEDY